MKGFPGESSGVPFLERKKKGPSKHSGLYLMDNMDESVGGDNKGAHESMA